MTSSFYSFWLKCAHTVGSLFICARNYADGHKVYKKVALPLGGGGGKWGCQKSRWRRGGLLSTAYVCVSMYAYFALLTDSRGEGGAICAIFWTARDI